MILHVAGVAHADPTGPVRLQRWLNRLRSQQKSPPAFVAVEWDQQIFERVRVQRRTIASLAKARWPQATPEFIAALSAALAYEGDAHLHVFPSALTLWLDEGRKPDSESDIAEFAVLRMRLYERAAEGISDLNAGALPAMSMVVWSSILPRPDGSHPRDDLFAKRLFDALRGTTGSWAIAILGANHASDSAGSAIDLLIHNGTECSVKLMNDA